MCDGHFDLLPTTVQLFYAVIGLKISPKLKTIIEIIPRLNGATTSLNTNLVRRNRRERPHLHPSPCTEKNREKYLLNNISIWRHSAIVNGQKNSTHALAKEALAKEDFKLGGKINTSMLGTR